MDWLPNHQFPQVRLLLQVSRRRDPGGAVDELVRKAAELVAKPGRQVVAGVAEEKLKKKKKKTEEKVI
jgi:hypothetical protein